MKLPRNTKLYIYIISILALILYWLLYTNYSAPSLEQFIFWIIITVITESISFMLPDRISASLTLPIILTMIVIGGPIMGALVAGIATLFKINFNNKKMVNILVLPFYKNLCNFCILSLVGGTGGLIYRLLVTYIDTTKMLNNVVVIITVAITVFVINILLMSTLIWTIINQNIISILRTNFNGYISAMLITTIMGFTLIVGYSYQGKAGVLLFLGPILLVFYVIKLLNKVKKIKEQ